MTLVALPQQSCLGGLLYTLLSLQMKKVFLDICLSVICLYIPVNLFDLLVVILAGENNNKKNLLSVYSY